ncbi:protein spinster homolog 1 [Xenopus laevis]|uniref:Protein spinster homolog 1 n=1 Tax=Xenopus laevis TaxID=8355 RepID=A0A8J1MJ34_XENLA|nr:protein spinster homolog 1 [Xenopus laevis]
MPLKYTKYTKDHTEAQMYGSSSRFKNIFRIFTLLFNLFNSFQRSKNSQQSPKEPDIESNAIHEEINYEQKEEKKTPRQISYQRAVLMVALYAYLNFVDFVDQFIFMAVLPIIIKDFHAVDITAEFITLAFLCTKVILSPSLSYATSRYNQKMVMCIGLFFYSSFSFGCTFIPKQGFWLFLLARLFVASMAECCFSAAPIVFVDIFYPDQRTRVLGFYTCIKTVCCILACLFGIPVIDLASSHWRYALWTTPGLGLFGLALAIIIMKNPQRGGMDEEENENEEDKLQCSCFSGLKELLTNCSFLTSTAGALCYACVYGAKNSWVSGLIEQAQKVLPIQSHCLTTGCNYDNLIYGIIRCAADLMGLIIGMELSKRYKKGNPAVDAVLCGIGLIVCAPFFMLFIFFPEINMPIAHVSIISLFFVQVDLQVIIHIDFFCYECSAIYEKFVYFNCECFYFTRFSLPSLEYVKLYAKSRCST